jgi:transposase
VLIIAFTFVFMYVRELKHKNGRIYVQVIDKSSGKYKVVKSFGSVKESSRLNTLIVKAKQWMAVQTGIAELDFANESAMLQRFLQSITAHRLAGIDYVLGKLFDEIGFDKIEDELFRDLVLYRLVYPKSKLKTTQFLYRYQQKQYSEDDIYRYMDKLHNTQKQQVQQISYEHTCKTLGSRVSMVFYDVTTIYFEIGNEDDLRKTGFSKEGKHQHPQIVLGLLVSQYGYPLAYDIFEGNKFEGHTMLPVINEFKRNYNLSQLVIIADSGLLSNANIEELTDGNYEFILGARIKNENQAIKRKILSLELQNGQSAVIEKGNLKLVVTYSDDRAAKDRYNRDKGLRRLEKLIAKGRLTKSSINNKGYNKYLKLEGELKISIDKNKYDQDAQWDGLKGYLTNAHLSKEEIVENYLHLWQIEKAFRITKTDLKIRPVYHRLQKRIEAHICLNFVAYKIYKELERQLKLKKSTLSPETVIDILQSIYEIEVTNSNTQETIRKVLLLTDEQKLMAHLFGFGC